jgi:hypothetical protein
VTQYACFIQRIDYNKNMGKEQQITTWIFVMLSVMRKRFSLPLSEFLPIVIKYKIVRFLSEEYELLHYYDNDYIVDDVVKYIEEQGGDINGLFRAG